MEITKDTYIDTLQRLKMVSSSTRNKCVDRAIFAIKDLEQFLDYRGKIVLRGFTDRSIIELQNAWDKACGSSAASSTNKPRRLTRILSQEEKSTISELEDLFESTYMGGCNVTQKEELDLLLQPTSFTLNHVNSELVFLQAFNSYLCFLRDKHRKPKIRADEEEYQLANWYHYILNNQDTLDNNYNGLVDTLKRCADTIDPESYFV